MVDLLGQDSPTNTLAHHSQENPTLIQTKTKPLEKQHSQEHAGSLPRGVSSLSRKKQSHYAYVP